MPDLQDAISLLESGNAREASQLLETMASEMPGYPTAHVLLARAYEQLSEWNLALRAWREALHMMPNSPVARRGLERSARKIASRSSADELAPPVHDAPAPPEELAGPTARGEIETPPKGDDVGVASLVDAETRREAEPPGEMDEHREPGDGGTPAEDVGRHGEGADIHREVERPPYRVEQAEAPESGHPVEPGTYTDLDRLIDELESARIVPRPDLDDLPAPDLEDDIEDVVSETLAKIYSSQGQYEEAAHVYEKLAAQEPERREEFMVKASDMRSRASDQR